MKVSQQVIDAMEAKGFVMVEGVAILNDTVVAEMKLPYEHTRQLVLNSHQAVSVFNNECSDRFAIFRPRTEVMVK